jgi:hypothetical protein
MREPQFVELRGVAGESRSFHCCVDPGLIKGNVHLFAASRRLAALFRNCARPAFSARFGLDVHQQPLFSHTIGYSGTGAVRP